MATEATPPPPEVVFYAFQYEECVIRARDIPYVKCPVHGDLPLEYVAPDTVSTRTCTYILGHVYWSNLSFKINLP